MINFTPGYEAYALAFGSQPEPIPWTVDPSQLGLPCPAQLQAAPLPLPNPATTFGLPALPQLVLPPVNPSSLSSFDGALASPLGLGPASQFDFGDFDESEEVPALELDEAEVQAEDCSPAQAKVAVSDLTGHTTYLRSSPPLPALGLHSPSLSPAAAPAAAPTPAPTATPSPRPSRSSAKAKPAPVATRTPLPTTSATRPNATGFRGAATKLVALDAPIGQRTYKKDSATSKKRKTTQTQRAMDKRRRAEAGEASGSATPGPSSRSSDGEHEEAVKVEEGERDGEEEIPDDLLSAEERKRRQNTLSARKSRQRKQERLGLLEEENVELKAELEGERSAHEETRRRLDEAVALLRTMGLA